MTTAIQPYKSLENCGFGEVYPAVSKVDKNETNRSKIYVCYKIIREQIVGLLKTIQNLAESALSYFGVHFARPIPSTSQLDLDIRRQQNLREDSASVGDWVTHNSVLITKNAKETTDWKLKLIQSANHSIQLSGSICGGKIFRKMLRAVQAQFEKQKQAGDLTLQVHITSTSDLLESKDLELLKKLSTQYENNFHFLKTYAKTVNFVRVENHVKLLVVDELYYIVGGTNCQDNLSREEPPKNQEASLFDMTTYVLGSGSRDMDAVVKGKQSAQIFCREFFKLYSLLEYKESPHKNGKLINHYKPIPVESETRIDEFDSHERLTENVQLKAVASCAETAKNTYSKAYAHLIKKADKAVTIANMYFDPTHKIKKSLHQIQLRGVPLTVITTGIFEGAPFSNHTYAHANARYCRTILQHNRQSDQNPTGVKIHKVYLYNKPKTIFHKKVAVFEKQAGEYLSIIGSGNHGKKSGEVDYETGIIFKNTTVANQILDILNEDKQDPTTEFTSDDCKWYEGINFYRIIGKIQHNLFHLMG